MSRQIVITLPEWTEIKQIDNKQFADLLPAYDEMLNMIKNGVPLPKHGRLFDERDIVNGNYKIIGNRIYELEPIIEADKESEDKE